MSWKTFAFEDCLERVKTPPKLAKNKYLSKGKFPVVAQEDSIINGYTNDESLIFKIRNPIIIFGDHTRKLKYIDFNFVLGADGAKIIKPKPNINVKFFFYYLSLTMPKNIGYARHYKLLKKIKFNIPSLTEQNRIVAKLDAAFTDIDKLIQKNFNKLNYIDEVKNSILDNKLGNNLIKLDEACDLIKRGISPKYLETGGICVINQKCIRNHKIDFSKARRHNINIKKVPEERFIKKDDVLINSTGQGTLGRVAQVREEPLEKTTVDSHITIVRPKQNLFNPNFFGNSLIKIEKQLQAAGEGTSGQTELSRSRLVNEFFIPYIKSIDKQKKIALLLDSMFEKTFILKNLTTKIIENQKALKTSFLYKEFNNKVA